MASTFSHPFTTPSSPPPRTSKQWKLALQRVKLLFAQRQYKQCAVQAEEILMTAREPIHAVCKTYLYFYSAISYGILGQAAHNYSSNKLGLLHSALDCFLICSAVLPSIIAAPEVVAEEAETEEVSSDTSLVDDSSSPWDSPDSSFMEFPLPARGPGGSLVSDLTRIIDDSMEWDEEDPFISDSGVHSTTATLDSGVVSPFRLPRDDSNKTLLMPSPLQIRKSSGTLGAAYANGQLGRSRCPPPLPIKIVPYRSGGNPVNTEEHSEHINAIDTGIIAVDDSATRASIQRYNNSIQFLRSQITTNITSTQTLIDEITHLQRRGKASKTLSRAASFWSFSPVSNTSKPGADLLPSDGPESGSELGMNTPAQQQQESKKERIARLRAEGWRTVGVKSRARGWKGAEYYKAYCNMVLDELYLDGTE